MQTEWCRFRWLSVVLASVAVLFSCGSPTDGANQDSNSNDPVDMVEKLARMVDLGPPEGSPGQAGDSEPVRAASAQAYAAPAAASATPIPFAPEPSPSTIPPYVNNCDDCVSGMLPIGFNFNFFGNTYQSFNISSNGFIGFDPWMTQGCCSGRPMPSNEGTGWNNIIAAAWTDLYPRGTGAVVSYETRGTAPNRRLIVEWRDVPWCCQMAPPRVSSQLILYETTNVIEIHTRYQESGHIYTQGVENADGTQAAFIPGRVAANYALSNDAVRFTTPGSTNRAPTVVMGGPYTGMEGSPLALTWAASDPDGDSLSYSWDFGDGTAGSGTALPLAHTYADNAPGSYTLRLTATDGKGGQDTKTAIVTILNAAPFVNAGADATVVRGQSFTLNGSFHDAGQNDGPWTYSIQWGDGTSTSGAVTGSSRSITAAHAYQVLGTFPVVLRVTDKDGATGTDLLVVRVVNQAPIATAGGPYTADEGSLLTLNGSGTDPDGDVLTFSWLFGDGQSGTGASPTHAYGDNGSYTASLTVSDGFGGTDTKTASVTILNVAPTVNAGADVTLYSGESLNLQGSFSDPGLQDTWSYTIDWGIGAPSSGSTATQGSITGSRGYLAAGTYTVVLTVRDDDGGESSDTLQVTVLRNPAQIDIKPGSSENPINLNDNGNGRVPVAILTTSTLDAAQVDAASVTLGDELGTDAAVARRNNGSLMASLEDVDGDGDMDLVLHFERAALIGNNDLTPGTTQLSLLGVLSDGRQLRGTDSVRVVP